MAKILRFFFISTIVFATLFFVFFNLYLKAQSSGLSKKVAELEKELKKSELENSELLQEIALRKSELDNLKLEYEKKISELESILSSKEEDMKQLRTQLKALENERSRESEKNPCVDDEYYNLILGDIELSKGNFLKSAEHFKKVDLSSVELGGLKNYYEKRKKYSFEKAGRELYLEGFRAFESKKYRESIDYFLRSIEYSNKSIYYFDDLLYYLGLAYLRTNNYKKALDSFEKLLHTYQFSDYTDEALLKVAQIYEELGNFEKALFYYKLLKLYGYTELANEKIEEIQKKLQR